MNLWGSTLDDWLRALALTQLCRSEREKILALYAFVKRIPFAKPRKIRLHK